MLEEIRLAVVREINSVYYFLADTLGLRFLDAPGTYVFIMVVSLAMIPFFSRNFYHIYTHPNEYENVSIVRKAIKIIITVAAFFFFGYANFTRFAVPA